MGLNVVVILFVIIVLFSAMSLMLYNPHRKKLQIRLQALATPDEASPQPASIVRQRKFSDVPGLNRWLLRIPQLQPLGRLLDQANSPYPVGVFLLVSALLLSCGFLLGNILRQNPLIHLVETTTLGAVPFLYIYRLKKQRMAKFESQLPDALDLMARSLKAGHPFRVGMRVVADEFSDPIGPEFSRTVDEMNFGVDVPDALKNLAARVDCPDLHFFITSVIVQRKTGGNLADILSQTSRLVRQRFEFQGRIKVLSAEGKISAIVLVAFPLVLAFVLNLLNPGYFTVLFTEPIGKLMLTGGSFMLCIGILVIKKMINIKA